MSVREVRRSISKTIVPRHAGIAREFHRGYTGLMSTAALVSLQEYLTTTYHPDCDYVDGVLVERNVGQRDHSELQGEVFTFFRSRRQELRLAAFVEQRIRVSTRRFRIPDICVVPLPRPSLMPGSTRASARSAARAVAESASARPLEARPVRTAPPVRAAR